MEHENSDGNHAGNSITQDADIVVVGGSFIRVFFGGVVVEETYSVIIFVQGVQFWPM